MLKPEGPWFESKSCYQINLSGDIAKHCWDRAIAALSFGSVGAPRDRVNAQLWSPATSIAPNTQKQLISNPKAQGGKVGYYSVP